MIIRQILILIISGLVLFFGYRYYKNDFCPGCCVDAPTAVTGTAAIAAGPLVFNWGNATPITKDGFQELKTDMLTNNDGTNSIEITGHYFADEKNDSDYENLGLARADAVGELLKEDNPELRIITKSKMVTMQEGAESNEFESISYAWISETDSMKETVEISETGDARILFPFNSSDKIDSPEVKAYLDNVAERLKEDNSLKAVIVGHTDSLGEPGANRRLSERRAKKIRDILKGKGVNSRQILPSGRGEADPVAPNTNEASRQLNRRVEITIK